MSDIDPDFKTLQASYGATGINQGDTVRAIYDLWKAVKAICNNLDGDSGTLGTDYLSYIGTPLDTAMAKFKTPPGPTGT